MSVDTILTAIIAVGCVLAIGTTATTLDATVSTDPEDAIDVTYKWLPISTEQAQNLDNAIDGEGATADGTSGTTTVASKPAATGDQTGTGATAPPKQSQQHEQDTARAHQQQAQQTTAKTAQKQSDSNSKQTQQTSGADSPPAKQLNLDDPTLREQLLALLHDLFDSLVRLLPFTPVVAGLAAAIYYRDRLWSWLGGTEDGTNDTPASPPSPQNEITKAWVEMVDCLDLTDHRALTPQEYAAAARQQGVDADTAQQLTELFQEVRYGNARVTEERQRHAKEILRTVRSQLEGEQ